MFMQIKTRFRAEFSPASFPIAFETGFDVFQFNGLLIFRFHITFIPMAFLNVIVDSFFGSGDVVALFCERALESVDVVVLTVFRMRKSGRAALDYFSRFWIVEH